MAANTCTSTSGTAAGTDPTFTVTQSIRNRKEGVYAFVKYTIGTTTALTLTLTTKCVTQSETITTTDAYSVVSVSGTALSALTYVISAAGNYKIPIALGPFDDTLVITAVFTGTAASGAAVINILGS